MAVEESKIFEIDGIEYQCRRLPAMQQFHLLRKVITFLGNINKYSDAEFLKSFIYNTSRFSDEDVEYIMIKCLSAVSRNMGQGRGFTKLVTNNTLMYNTMKVSEMLLIAVEVLRFNFEDFLALFQQNSHQDDQK